MTSLSCKVKSITAKYFKMILNKTVLILMRITRLRFLATQQETRRNKKIVKKDAQNWFTWSYKKWQTMHILQLCGAAWSSRWLMVQLTNGQHTCELVFKPKVDILNIRCDYQFVFSELDEL